MSERSSAPSSRGQSTGQFTDRNRHLLRALKSLAADRSAAEAAVTRQYEERGRAASEFFEEEGAVLRERFENDMASANATYADAKRRIQRERGDELAKTERARDEERTTILQKAERNEREARTKLDEAIWATETVFEANQDRPRKLLKEAEGQIDDARSKLLEIAEEARRLVRRYRQKIPPPPGAGDDDDATDAAADATSDASASALETRMTETIDRADGRLARLRRQHLAGLFRGVRMPILVLLGTAGASFAAWRQQWQVDRMLAVVCIATFLGLLVLAAVLYFIARRQIRTVYGALALEVRDGLVVCDRAHAAAEAECEREEDELLRQRDEDVRMARAQYEPILAKMRERRKLHVERIEQKYPKTLESIRRAEREELEEAGSEHERRRTEVQTTFEAATAELEREHAARVRERETLHVEEYEAMERAWKDGMAECTDSIESIVAEDVALFPAWNDTRWEDWSPPATFSPSVRFGTLGVDMTTIPGAQPADERLIVPGPERFTLPATLDFPDRCSLLLVSGAEGRDEAVDTLKTVMLRLLTSLPPGKVRFTILDPVGLGQNFAGFMHLADYEEAFVASRIWTETRHIEQRLGDLCEHMETVIQKYLRNEFATIADYNEQAGEIAEPYRFLVISDFPANFSEIAARRLASIVSSGARCGVHTLISRDARQDVPKGLDPADMEAGATTLLWKDGRFRLKDEELGAVPLSLEAPPAEEFLTRTLHLVGEASKDATRVEVPFDVIAPRKDHMWSRSCSRELAVPLGRSGATKLQELVIGPGTAQHALIAGKTGSGKSTLLHVLVTNLALWYSPDEVQFYLVDFKKGVEFKTYATHDLPHVRAVAIESDREFGLSVLQRIDIELKRRGDRFRDLHVQDLAGFRRAESDQPMPRTLLIVDEFQEMFVEDDKLGQDAALILDRLVRQGRAFGIHVLLGSQTLGGAYTLARSTMGQMQVRIALQCSEADSYLIMSDDNAAARLLARPGEAIYNDAGGAVEGNSPFQICWLPEAVRDERLHDVAQHARAIEYRRDEPAIVFEGNVPADVRGNHELAARLERPGTPTEDGRPRPPHAWLGDAIAIKGPTAAIMRRQSGNNLLLVGQREESALAMTATAIVSLAAHATPESGARFVILDGCPLDSPHAGYLARLADLLPYDIRNVQWRDVEGAFAELAEELTRRQDVDATEAPPIYLVIYGLQRFRMLRASDDFGFSMSGEDKGPAPDKQFGDILRDGSPVCIHTIAWCDTATNLNRTLDRTGLREFEMRVLFQMSGADSTQLIDTPAASKLGMRRALYFNEEEGVLEKFRPYALPDVEWLRSIGEQLGRVSGAGAPES